MPVSKPARAWLPRLVAVAAMGLGLITPAEAAASADTAAPVLTSISVINPSIDVTSAPGAIAVALLVTDDDTGFSRAAVKAHCSSGCPSGTPPMTADSPSFEAGTPTNDELTYSLPVAQQTPQGSVWTVDYLQVTDRAGNSATYGANATAFPSSPWPSFTVTRTSDTTPPTVGQISYDAPDDTVDVTQFDQFVGVSVDLGDTFPGIDPASVSLTLSPSSGGPSHTIGSFELLKGSRHAGTFVAEDPHPFTYADRGVWTVTKVEARDLHGNLTTATGPATGTWPTLTVHGDLDTSGPQLHPGASLSATSAQSGDDLLLTTTITDDATGLAQAAGTFTDGSGHSFSANISPDDATASDTYVSIVHVPTTVPAGTYALSRLSLVDRAGHTTAIAAGDPALSTLSVDVTAPAPDAGAPALAGVQIGEPTLALVDTSSPRADVAYLNVTDPAGDSGFDHGTVAVSGPSGSSMTVAFGGADRVSGDEHSGTYRISIQPMHSGGDVILGRYSLGAVQLWTTRDADQPTPSAAADAGNDFDVTLGAGTDTSLPTLDNVDVSPATVDTTSSDQVLTAAVHVTDTGGAGVASFDLQLSSTTSSQMIDVFGTTGDDGSTQLINGDDTSGTFVVDVPMPRGSAPGDWTLTSADIVDYAGNENSSLAIAGQHTIRNNASSADTTAPSLAAFQVDQSPTVDTSGGQVAFTGTAELMDADSGVVGIDLALIGPTGQTLWADGGRAIEAYGGHDVTLPWHITVPVWARSGDWHFAAYTLDVAGNYEQISDANLTSAGAPTVHVTGVADTRQPWVKSWYAPTLAVSVVDGPTDEVVTVNVADDASGIADFTEGDITPADNLSAILQRSSAPFLELSESSVHVIGGTPTNVWIRLDVHFQPGDEGLSNVHLQLQDLAGNLTSTGLYPSFDVHNVVQGQPGDITNVVVTPQPHAVSLSWPSPASGGSPIDHYVVDVSGDGMVQSLPVPVTAAGAVASGLTPGKQYRFAVSAWNATAESEHATTVDATPLFYPAPTISFPNPINQYASTDAYIDTSVTSYEMLPPTLACSVDASPVACKTDATQTDYRGLPEGPHTFTITATNSDGVSASRSESWVTDLTKPVVSLAKLPSTSLAPTFPLSWKGTDLHQPITFDFRFTVADWNTRRSGWKGWHYFRGDGRTVFPGKLGHEYCLSMLGFDAAGNETPWSAPTCTAVPLDDRSLTPSWGWTRVTGRSLFNGTATETTHRGVTLTRAGAIAGRAALLVDKAAGYGSVAVYYNGRLVKTLSLGATRSRPKQLVALPRVTKATTIVIKTTSTKKVRIDGLLLARV